MAVATGKRKRNQESDNDASDDEAAIRAKFQRAFEAKFKPLPFQAPSPPVEVHEETGSDEEDEDESDWDGIDDDVEDVAVVQYAMDSSATPDLERPNRKSFMSSKPPTSEDGTTRLKATKTAKPEEDEEESTNLKHDLALQRLLKESHLLDPAATKTRQPELGVKGRLKALDLRLKDLGAKDSISEQVKMPLSHRKGIAAKSSSREAKRREDAAANGVVLERAKYAAKFTKPREKSIGGPNVGKFRAGTLKLNSKDLRSIQGPKKQMRSGGKSRARF